MILDQIVADNRLELETRKRGCPEEELQRAILEQPSPLDLASALRGDRTRRDEKAQSPSSRLVQSWQRFQRSKHQPAYQVSSRRSGISEGDQAYILIEPEDAIVIKRESN